MSYLHDRHDLVVEATNQAVRASPAAAVAVPILQGAQLSSLVLVLTVVYLLLQMGFLMHRWWRMWRRPNVPGGDE